MDIEHGLLNDLHARAIHDPLTGLLNRGQLEEQLVCAERQARRTGRRLAVLAVDLDGFKLINDTRGHAAGDSVLRAMTQRIAHSLNPDDLVGRAGGDEFMVFLRDIDKRGGLERTRGRLLACFSRPFELADGPLFLSASVGAGVHPNDAGSISQLIAFADATMYHARLRGYTEGEQRDRG